MMHLPALSIRNYSLVTALGAGARQNFAAIRSGRHGLRPCDLEGVDLDTWIGRIEGVEVNALPSGLQRFDCRNNRLALWGLETDGFSQSVAAAIRRHGASRVGVILGTSTSGIAEAEWAYAKRDLSTDELPAEFRYDTTHVLSSLTDFCQAVLGTDGPALTVSTACSSSAKVFAAGARYLATGLCDAVVVGGVDSLCLTTLYGFRSLGLLSASACVPWDAARDGISIGEAAGFALLERGTEGALLVGYGESADAYHMSAPHPEGEGARLAMLRALERAGLEVAAIDYVNLHGTGTRLNDASEDQAMQRVFGSDVAASSTKGWTGHTLGASGVTEAILSLLTIEYGWIPPCRLRTESDPALGTMIETQGRSAQVRHVMSNSFGFGGSNCSLIFEAAR